MEKKLSMDIYFEIINHLRTISNNIKVIVNFSEKSILLKICYNNKSKHVFITNLLRLL